MSARYTLIQDPVTGKLLPPGEYYAAVAAHKKGEPSGIQLMTDIAEPVVSPVDGSLLASRADVREHNIRNGVVDVGNDPAYRNPQRRDWKPEPAGPLIARIIREEVPAQKGVRIEE